MITVETSRITRYRIEEIQAEAKYALNGGPFGSKLGRKDYEDSGVPVIRGVNLAGESLFDESDFVFVSEEKADELLPNNAHPGDVVFTQRGTLGQVGLIPLDSKFDRYVISQSQMKLTVDDRLADSRYVYYYFRARDTVTRILNHATQSGVPHINLDTLRKFEIDLPPLETQRQIADILSAYDDLIENNTRRIQILEEMARTIYREWFVHFRYPGHESVPLVDSPIGPVPEGWEMVQLKDVAAVNAESVRKGDELGEIRYINISSVSPGRIDEIERMPFDDAPSRARRRVHHGDVIWSTVRPNRQSYALILNPPENIIVSTGFAVLSAKTLPFSYLYEAVTTNEFVAYLANNATGSAYPAVTAEVFESADMLLPSESLLHHFAEIVSPLYSLAENLRTRNHILSTTRDLLLPRLLSGTVRALVASDTGGPIQSLT